MSNRFASGKHAIAECDRCSFRYPLKVLRRLVIKTKNVNMLVCPSCWEPDHPQLQLGLYPVEDPQALRNPRPDASYRVSGPDGLQTQTQTAPAASVFAFGQPRGGSRVIQWGWNPVGLSNPLGLPGLDDNLQANGQVGSVSIVVS
jgi:hypothetical protein